jgi:hypothetical protein
MDKNNLQVFLGDGLGHGPDANTAVAVAMAAFRVSKESSPSEIIRVVHNEVKKTRGLVGTIVNYSFKEKSWTYAGVGNIAARLLNPLTTKNCMSYNGIIGLNLPNTIKNQVVMAEPGQTMIMCSDGIRSRWEAQRYPNISRYDASIQAAAIYKDFVRKTDDVSVVVIRINQKP